MKHLRSHQTSKILQNVTPPINTSHLQDMSLQKTDHASNRYSSRRVLHTQTQALGSNRSHFWVRFLSLAWNKLRLCSANDRPGYWSNLPCDWPSTAWAYSEQETENGPWSLYAPQVDCICLRFPWSMSKTATPDSQIMILRNTEELPYITMYGIHWKVQQFWEIPMDVGCHILAFSKFEKPLKWTQFVYTGNPSNG